MRERERDLRGGLWTLVVPVGCQLVQPIADSIRVMLCMVVAGDASPLGADTLHQGKDDEEQEGKPYAVRGKWLGQDGKQFNHVMNLPDTRLCGSYIRC